MLKKILLFSSFLLILGVGNLQAQGYGTAIGLRVGNGFGLTLKQQIALRATAEGIVETGFSDKSTTFSLLVMRHINIISRVGNFYVGGGFHRTRLPDNSAFNGASVIGGFELNFKNLNISADYKPQLNFGGDRIFNNQMGISLRYILFDRPFKNDNWKFWKKRR